MDLNEEMRLLMEGKVVDDDYYLIKIHKVDALLIAMYLAGVLLGMALASRS